MTVVGWVDTTGIRTVWPDAPEVPTVLEPLLLAAYEVCVEFAPALADGVEVPARYVHAQVLQARAIYQAARRDGDVMLMEDGVGVQVPPLSRMVRSLLRPDPGVLGIA